MTEKELIRYQNLLFAIREEITYQIKLLESQVVKIDMIIAQMKEGKE